MSQFSRKQDAQQSLRSLRRYRGVNLVDGGGEYALFEDDIPNAQAREIARDVLKACFFCGSPHIKDIWHLHPVFVDISEWLPQRRRRVTDPVLIGRVLIAVCARHEANSRAEDTARYFFWKRPPRTSQRRRTP